MDGAYEVRPGFWYTEGDTWVCRTSGGQVRMGITDYAQKKLKKIEYLNLPEEGEAVTQGESLGEVESQKSVSDLMAPVTGTVLEHNEEAVADPTLLNTDPYGAGWVLSLDCPDLEAQGTRLMEAEAYLARLQAKEQK